MIISSKFFFRWPSYRSTTSETLQGAEASFPCQLLNSCAVNVQLWTDQSQGKELYLETMEIIILTKVLCENWFMNSKWSSNRNLVTVGSDTCSNFLGILEKEIRCNRYCWSNVFILQKINKKRYNGINNYYSIKCVTQLI